MNRRAFTAVTAASYSRILGANERIGAGYIGLGARGDRLHDIFLAQGARTTAICDLIPAHLDLAASKAGAGARRVKDYRAVLDDPAVEAVVIATPDHWHALMFVDACRAGKDIYVEKPMSLTVVEGRRMVEAAAAARRVVQAGMQRRSSAMVREAAELVRSGGLGRITMVRACDNLNEWPAGIGKPPAQDPPQGFDWDAWLGPARKVPYNANRTWYNYRWFRDYSCGQITNNGIHLLDIVRWALGVDAPLRVAAFGGRYAVGDNREIPDTLEAMWEFPGPVIVTFTQLNANDAPMNEQRADLEFRGTKGTLYLHADRFEVVPQQVAPALRYRPSPVNRGDNRARWIASRKQAVQPVVVRGNALADTEHVRNFLDCMRTRKACNADAETGHRSTLIAILGDIALRSGATLEWDSTHEKFRNNEAANRLLHYRYRAPYKLG